MALQELRIPIGRATPNDIVERMAGIRRDAQSGGTLTTRVTPMWEWDLIIRAARAAVKRYEDSLVGDHAIDARAAVGEALWWIASADELLGKRLSFDVSPKDYYLSLGQTRPGRLVGALAFLRNRAGHQIADVFAGTPLESTSASYTVIGDDGVARDSEVVVSVVKRVDPFAHADPAGYNFATLDELPSPDKRVSESFKRDLWYSETVTGQAVGSVLAEGVDILSRAMKLVRQGKHVEVQIHAMLDSTLDLKGHARATDLSGQILATMTGISPPPIGHPGTHLLRDSRRFSHQTSKPHRSSRGSTTYGTRPCPPGWPPASLQRSSRNSPATASRSS